MPGELLYRIVDEPVQTRVSRLAVRPLWPWLALALGGAWAGVPWFAVNAFALGSPTRKKELTLALLLPVASVCLFGAVILLAMQLPKGAVPYLLIPVHFLKLLVGYLLLTWQSRAFQLHEHFGGEIRNGLYLMLASTFLRTSVLAALESVTVSLALAAM